jgi:hypothetical protein
VVYSQFFFFRFLDFIDRDARPDRNDVGDILALDKEDVEGETLGKPLIKACICQGERCLPAVSLDEIWERVARELNRLPESLRSLKQDFHYPVEISNSLKKVSESLDLKLKSSCENLTICLVFFIRQHFKNFSSQNKENPFSDV